MRPSNRNMHPVFMYANTRFSEIRISVVIEKNNRLKIWNEWSFLPKSVFSSHYLLSAQKPCPRACVEKPMKNSL